MASNLQMQSPAAPTAASTRVARVLVVGDDRVTCLVLRKVMEQDGYRVQITNNGAAAIAACERTHYDMVLLDYLLPDMDGTQVCAVLRKQPRYASVPVLLLTSRNDNASAKAAVAAGANDYITKPFLVPVLRQRVRDLLASRETEKLMRHLAYYDALTGLANRASFHQQLDDLLAMSRAGDITQHAVMWLDLDRFKLVNDTCGHTAGDELLRQIGGLLQTKLRQTDTLARLGGDEFGALLVDCSADDALTVAETLRAAVAQFCFFWQGKTFTIGVSIGVATLNEHTGQRANVLAAADAACYTAKNSGRNQVSVHVPDAPPPPRRRSDLHWGQRINEALSEYRFALEAQPIAPLGAHSNRASHAEILLHLIDEQGELINRSAFISPAERYGVMHAVDEWMLSRALGLLEQRGAWHTPMSTYWISISGTSMKDPDFLDFAIEQMHRFAVPAGRLCLQVTETALAADLLNVSRFMDALIERGALFALDEFSAAPSSFRGLPLSKVRFLKIDHHLLGAKRGNAVDIALVRATNDIAHALQIQTVAKQVNDPALMYELRDLGTDFVQGDGVMRAEPLLALG